MALDDLDRDLLRSLQKDGRLSHRELARRHRCSVPTVSARIGRMVDAGVIRGYTVVLDPEAFGGAPHSQRVIDVGGEANVVCHTCDQRTANPVWWRGDGRSHPFCCPMCKAHFVKRYEAAAEGL